MGAALSVVGFLTIIPDDASSGGGGYVLFLLTISFVLTVLAKGEMLPVAIGVVAASSVMMITGLGGDNDGLQLLILPWLMIIALLVMVSSGAGRELWLRVLSSRSGRNG